MELVKCALCDADDYNVILTAKDNRYQLTNEIFQLVQCNNCGLIYLNPRPTKKEMGKFYPQEYYGNQNLVARNYVKLLQIMKIRKIMKYKKEGQVLDIGCGDGTLLLHFKEKGWDTYGVDISGPAHRLTRDKLKQNIFNCELKDCHFPDRYFDVITLNHVLEHVMNPNDELREIYRILKNDGILFLSVPNIDSFQFKISKEHWFHLDLPRHIYHYSLISIKDLLEKNKFIIIEVRYPLLNFPLDIFYSLINNYSKFQQIVYLFLPITLLFKLSVRWRGCIEIFAQKQQLSCIKKSNYVLGMSEKIVILGAGLAGLSATYHLKDEYEIYEKKTKIGGVASSEKINGFIFDYGIHVLHTKNRYVLNLLDGLHIQNRKAWIYIYDTYIKYPFQANLYGLPIPIVKECVLEFIKSKYERKIDRFKNYAEWLYTTFGKGITDHFMIPYSKKMWTVDPKDLTLEWVDIRFPQPTLDEVLEGALDVQKKEFGPNIEFRYPLYGGIQTIPDTLGSKVKNINLNKEAIKINLKRKKIYFKDGEEVHYDKLISTMPLPELVKIIKKIPTKIRNAAKNLKWTSDFCVNLGVDRSDLSDKHWIYFPEEKFPFLRISFPQNLSPYT